MRTLLKVTMPVEAANKAVKDGTLAKTLKSSMEELRPEASYFYTENGQRTGLIIFDMKDASQMPSIAEPFFLNLNAAVELHPIMNMEDLKIGLEKAAKKTGRVPVAA
jgi:hypothetical protein